VTVETISKAPSDTWKAVVRERGWPVTIKTFSTKHDAADRARSMEDGMLRGVYINRARPSRNCSADSGHLINTTLVCDASGAATVAVGPVVGEWRKTCP
jgi:hypothetical protein